MQTIRVNGKEIKYALRQGNSRQCITLKFISEDELEIILPQKHIIDIEALLKKKISLIQRKHSEYIQASTPKDQILLFGKFYDTEINRKSAEYSIAMEDTKIRVNLPKSVKAKDAEYEYLKKWIKRQLMEILDKYMSIYERKMQAPVNRVYIKNQKTRWASFTPKHNLNFNIKLAALPENIIEYIVIHELAHAIELSHNKKFWQIVRKFCADYKERKQELTRYLLSIQKNIIWQRVLKTSQNCSVQSET